MNSLCTQRPMRGKIEPKKSEKAKVFTREREAAIKRGIGERLGECSKLLSDINEKDEKVVCIIKSGETNKVQTEEIFKIRRKFIENKIDLSNFAMIFKIEVIIATNKAKEEGKLRELKLKDALLDRKQDVTNVFVKLRSDINGSRKEACKVRVRFAEEHNADEKTPMSVARSIGTKIVLASVSGMAGLFFADSVNEVLSNTAASMKAIDLIIQQIDALLKVVDCVEQQYQKIKNHTKRSEASDALRKMLSEIILHT
ncbi:hypothetical protein AAMO2058_001094000 [Amorphochlora amoebiformis]